MAVNIAKLPELLRKTGYAGGAIDGAGESLIVLADEARRIAANTAEVPELLRRCPPVVGGFRRGS